MTRESKTISIEEAISLGVELGKGWPSVVSWEPFPKGIEVSRGSFSHAVITKRTFADLTRDITPSNPKSFEVCHSRIQIFNVAKMRIHIAVCKCHKGFYKLEEGS